MEFCGHYHQVCYRVGLHLLHDQTAVCLDCALGDTKLATSLFIKQAGYDQCHDTPFASRERLVTMSEFLHLRVLCESEAAPFQGLPNRAQQYFVIERLGQELDRPSLHCSDCHG